MAILHCVSSYPVVESEANLLAIKTLKKKFPDCIIGYSDHTQGILAPIAAVTLGAEIIEVHITSDKTKNFFDNNVSFDYNELEYLLKLIRVSEDIRK